MSKKPLVVKPVLVEAIPNTNMTDYDRLLKNHGDPLQQEPIYQYQMANGSWIDQTKESHDYNVRHGQATVRIVYTSPPAQEIVCSTGLCHYRKPLMEKEIAKIFDGLPSAHDQPWFLRFARAIEAAHGIKENT